MKTSDPAPASDSAETHDPGSREDEGAHKTAPGTEHTERNGADTNFQENLLAALRALEHGDLAVRLREAGNGMQLEIAHAFNGLASQSECVCSEIRRIGRMVGLEGRVNDRAHLQKLEGSWLETIDSVNALISDLVHPTTEIARVLTAVAEGDLSQKMSLAIDRRSVQGEFLRIGTTVNRMVDQLGSFAAEVTRVAREVGTDGKLGGQAQVPGVAGTWKDLTDNVNSMALRL